MKFTDKLTGKALAVACAAVMVASLAAVPAFADPAADEGASPSPQAQSFNGTTYRVAVYAGNQGTVNGSDKVVFDGENAVQPGSTFDFNQLKVEVPDDSKYYAKGIRLAALDNVQSDNIHGDAAVETTYYVTANDKGDMVATNPAIITEDTDFVVAYGIKANRVAYTVTYTDADGNQLAEPQRFYGDIGDRPAVAAAYIEGYVPRTDVRLQTLTANEADNVFPFVYTRLAEGTTTEPNPSGGVDITLPTGQTIPNAYTTTVTPEGVAAAAANPVAAPTPGAGLVTADDAVAEPLVADDGTEVLADDGTPLNAPTQESIEDDGTALAAGEGAAQPGNQQLEPDRSWMPWAIAAIILAAAIAFIIVRGRSNDDDEAEETPAA